MGIDEERGILCGMDYVGKVLHHLLFILNFGEWVP